MRPPIAPKWNVRPAVLGIVILTVLFAVASPRIVGSLDYVNSDFFKVWLAARLAWSGQDPYDPETWIGENRAHGSDWISEDAFLYPIGLALMLAPLGALGIYQAYVVWVFLSLLMILAALLLLVTRRGAPVPIQVVVPLVVGAFAFRPVLVTVRNGQLGALLLILVVLALRMWENGRWLLGGVVLGLILVKPNVGAPVGCLITAWAVLTGRWKAALGFALAVAAILALGWLQDPGWVGKYLEVLGRKAGATLGFAPSLWGWVGLACRDVRGCLVPSGLLATALLIGLALAHFGIRRRDLETDLAIATAVPVALLVTPYMWAYDQVLLLVPLVISVSRMQEQGFPYLATAPLLLYFSLAAVLLVLVAATIGRDAWSAALSLAVFVGAMGLSIRSAWAAQPGQRVDAPRPS
jgi:hypothetical protein